MTFVPKKSNPVLFAFYAFIAPYAVAGILYAAGGVKPIGNLMVQVGDRSTQGFNEFYAMLFVKPEAKRVDLPVKEAEPSMPKEIQPSTPIPLAPVVPSPENPSTSREDAQRDLEGKMDALIEAYGYKKRYYDQQKKGGWTEEQLAPIKREMDELKASLDQKREEYLSRYGREYRS